jgi:hypothetical protein
VTYRQYLVAMNRPMPEEWIDATWPVMKKIEADLIAVFGLTEIPKNLETGFRGVRDPEKKQTK